MTARGQWIFEPNSGGKKIPPSIQTEVERRIRKVAEEHFNGRYTRLEIRFRNQFCYIDAYTEPSVSENWPPPIGTKPGMSLLPVCATRQHTCAGCVTSAMIAGGLLSLPTAAKNMSYPCSPAENFLERPKMRFSSRRKAI